MKVRLCDKDRELFGCAEWLEWSPADISIDDLDELAGRFNFDPEEWPEPFFGQLTLEQAGDPEAKPKPPPWRSRAVIWMMLRQNGHPVSWEETGKAHPYLAQTDVPTNDVTDVTPGKAPLPPSAPSTTRRSRTSTGSRKKPSAL